MQKHKATGTGAFKKLDNNREMASRSIFPAPSHQLLRDFVDDIAQVLRER